MKAIRIEYKVKAPANDKEADLRITEVLAGCETDGSEMRFVGRTSCVHDDYYTYMYQCPTCKLVEIHDYPFGYSTPNLDAPESKWERVTPIQGSNG